MTHCVQECSTCQQQVIALLQKGKGWEEQGLGVPSKWPAFAEGLCCGAAISEASSELWGLNCGDIVSTVQSLNYTCLECA